MLEKQTEEKVSYNRQLSHRIFGFRLGIYIFKDAEVIDFTTPYGVFSVARRFDPELDAFLLAEALRPIQTQAGFTVLPNYSFNDAPAMDAFLIRRIRHKTGNAQQTPVRFYKSASSTVLANKRMHRIMDLREDVFTRRHTRH
jgi:transcriptional regulator GlxA family with amidase domain